MDLIIRKMEASDYDDVKRIYIEGIETKNATFEKSAPEWDEWNSKKISHSRLAALLNNNVVGWAALSATSDRHVYRGINEVSIYIAAAHSGKGIGKKLMESLIEESEKNGVWTLYSSIFPENTSSISLHKSCGFREIGYMEKAGCMDGVWRDTVLLERRSKVAGV